MRLRPLETKDIPGMLEWMHDPAVNRFFRFDASGMDEKKAAGFVESAAKGGTSLHLACVNEADEYLGTISLKNIDAENKTAEYAISFRRAAQGTGAARYATREILRRAFEELGLEKVYLDVLEENGHACRFYEKQGFQPEGCLRQHILLAGRRQNLRLYGILKEEWKTHG